MHDVFSFGTQKHSGYGLRVISDLSIVDIQMDDAHTGEIRENITKNYPICRGGPFPSRTSACKLQPAAAWRCTHNSEHHSGRFLAATRSPVLVSRPLVSGLPVIWE